MKRIFFRLLAILALASLCGVAGFYAMSANAKGNNDPPAPTAPRSPTAKPETCTVVTGIDEGTVNLRACAGAACGAVLDILTEGEMVRIITPGEWLNVTTESGVTGWLKSNYCR